MSAEAQHFLTELQMEVEDRAAGADGTAPDFRENVFTEYVMELLSSEVGIVENPQACHFSREIGRGQAKISGFAIGEDAQDEQSIDLFISVYRGSSEITEVPSDKMQNASKQAVRFFTAALDNLHASLDPSQPSYAMARRISEAKATIKNARLFILTDGQSDLSRRKSATLDIKGLGIPLRIEFWDIERLSRVVSSGTPQSDIEIDVVAMNGTALPCVTTTTVEDDHQAFVMIIPGSLLFRMYDEYGATLLQRNVRSFLQAKGKVNKGIRESLKSQPGRFLAFNNGISLTAESVETTGDGATRSITLIRGLQIVNGGQTTASIHRAGKIDKFDLSKVFVQAKLTVLKPEVVDSLAPKIAEFANTQNPVQMADFSANDPFHVEFERLSKVTWAPDGHSRWFYERTRGQYFVELSRLPKGSAKEKSFKDATPKHRRLGKIDVAKFIVAWEQRPSQVSLGFQKNFVQFTQQMRETTAKTWRPDDRYYKETIAKAILFNAIVRLGSTTKFKEFKQQLAAHVVASIAFKTGGQLDLMQIWQQQRLSLPLEDMLSQWIAVIGDAIVEKATEHARSPSEWCKRADCWKGVQQIELPLPKDAPPELQKIERSGGSWGVAPKETRVALDPDELDARQKCRQLEPGDWIRIVDWGTRSGALEPRQRDVATEIASCAASGWTRDLTAKKALAGREIIKLAIDNGVFEVAEVA